MNDSNATELPLIDSLELNDVPATALMTLACRAAESISADPILHDPLSEEWFERLRPAIAGSRSATLRRCSSGQMNPDTQVYVALRARRFDRYVREYVQRFPGARVVNLGCGLDTRFARLQDSDCELVDLDLREMIEARRALGDLRDHAALISSSVLDLDWLDRIPAKPGDPILFLAEGLFMYLEAGETQRLVGELARRFPGSGLVCEVFNAFWLEPGRRNQVDERLRRELGFGEGAMFKSGLRDSREMESWVEGVALLDEWSHLDEPEPKLGRLRKLKHFPKFRRMQWAAFYRLGATLTD